MKKFTIFLFIFGCVMSIGGLFYSVSDTIFKKTAVATNGSVGGGHTELSSRTGINRSSGYYKPIYVATIIFTTKTGEVVRFPVELDTINHPQNGAAVQVLYDPRNPQHARLASQTSVSRDIMIFISGVILVFASIFFYSRAFRNS